MIEQDEARDAGATADRPARQEPAAPGRPARQEPAAPGRPARRAPDMPWAGWGEPAPIPPRARELLAELLGADLKPAPSVPEDEVALPPSRLSPAAHRALAAAAGPGQVHTGRADRLLRTGGKSTTDLLRRRAGDAAAAPDAVVT